jgi:hypothetical protein
MMEMEITITDAQRNSIGTSDFHNEKQRFSALLGTHGKMGRVIWVSNPLIFPDLLNTGGSDLNVPFGLTCHFPSGETGFESAFWSFG